MQTIVERAKELSGEIIQNRRHQHQNPEVGLEMPLAYEFVSRKLTEMGYTPQRVGGYGVVALAGGKRPGKTFLIRADMDALPMAEETGLDFAATGEAMHACGHDTHTAMLLGAARILKEREGEIAGTVKIFFQTAEETLEGAKEALDAGLLENPHVDAALMIHIASATPLPSGTMCTLSPGACYASADWWRVDVTGKGGHGAQPHTTVSAVNIACAINEGIQEIMSVVVPRSAFTVMTVGQIHAGSTSNIIPETAFLSGTIRAFDEEVRADIKAKLAQMAENAARARGGTAAVSYSNSAPAAVNNKDVSDAVLAIWKQSLGEKSALDMGAYAGGKFGRITGSEDFAYIAEKVPSAVAWLSAGTPEEGYTYAAHNPKTDFKEDVLYVGAAAYATAALGWLAQNP